MEDRAIVNSLSAQADAPRWRSLRFALTERLLHLALACRRHKQTLRYRQRDSLDINELLPEQVIKNIEAIATHQDRYRQNSTVYQRGLDKITAIFSQSQFLYFQIIFFTIWWICSHLSNLQILPADFPQFDLREEGLDVAALLISTGVLIYQTRQEQVSEERSHLMLQLNLITEQKIAKLISLVEELRTDLPNVRNRADLEAEIMQQAIDPQAILEVIQQNSEHTPTPPIEVENR